MSSHILVALKWFVLIGICLAGSKVGEFVIVQSGANGFWWESVVVPLGTWTMNDDWGRLVGNWIYPILDAPYLLWTIVLGIAVALIAEKYFLMLGSVYLLGRLSPFVLDHLSVEYPRMEPAFFVANMLWRALALPVFVLGATIPRSVTMRRGPKMRNSIWQLLVFSAICAFAFTSEFATRQIQPEDVTIGWWAAIGPPLTCFSLLTFFACIQNARVREHCATC